MAEQAKDALDGAKSALETVARLRADLERRERLLAARELAQQAWADQVSAELKRIHDQVDDLERRTGEGEEWKRG